MWYGEFTRPIIDKKNLHLACEQLERQRQANDEYADSNFRLAEAYFFAGDFKNANAALERALVKNADYFMAQILQVKIALEQGGFDEARQYIKPIRQQYDGYADVVFLNAVILFFSGDYLSSLLELRYALDINKEYLNAALVQMIVYRITGRLAELFEVRNKILEQQGDDIPDRLFYNGLTCYEQGHYASAILAFEGALSLGWKKNMCLYNSACAYALLERYEQTADILGKIAVEDEAVRERVREDDDLAGFRESSFARGIG